MLAKDERAAAREAKRQANREAWFNNPLNVNTLWRARQAELEAASATIVVEPAEAETGSLARLRRIMSDTSAPLSRRLDAGEVVLTYELAPASLVNSTPEQVAAASFRFMQAVADADDTPEQLRFRALKNIAQIENARATRVDRDQQVEKQNLQRRLGPDAPEMPADLQWPPTDIAAKLDRLTRQRRLSR